MQMSALSVNSLTYTQTRVTVEQIDILSYITILYDLYM